MLVSIIIPCYNVQNYIEECVTSAINQTYKNIEIICIDNNSTDTTWNELVKLKQKHPTIIIDKELKPGAPAARNKGINLSSGEWLQFLDADDLLLPNKIELQATLITDNLDIEFAFIAAAHIKRLVNNTQININLLNDNKYTATFLNKTGNTCSNLWNKKDVLAIGAWNEVKTSSQEADLMLRLISNNKSYIVDNNANTIIRDRISGQISQGNKAKKWIEFIDIRINYLQYLKQNKQQEYNKHNGILMDFLMNSILSLAYYDKLSAINYYNSFVKHNWNSAGTYGFNKIKTSLINYLGLNMFLKINAVFKK